MREIHVWVYEDTWVTKKKKLNLGKQNVGLFTMVRALQQHMDLLTQKRVKLQQLKTHLSCISKQRRTCKVEMSIGRENAVVHILFCWQNCNPHQNKCSN